jgi:tetratricopeptide (TPR) repeat protein
MALTRARLLYERALAHQREGTWPGTFGYGEESPRPWRSFFERQGSIRARPTQEHAGDLRDNARPRASRNGNGSRLPGYDASGTRRTCGRKGALRMCAGNWRESIWSRASQYSGEPQSQLIRFEPQGDLAGAQALCDRALAIQEEVFGPEDPGMTRGLISLARVLQDSGARPLFERALAIYKKTPAHPSTNRARYLFVGRLLAEGNAFEALRESEAALAGLERALGKNNRRSKHDARTTADAGCGARR